MHVAATTDPVAIGAADVVLVQCKAASTTAAVRNALDAGLFREDTVAISFQNGLGNEEMIADVVGAERVLGGVTAQGASIEGPGCIRSYADLPSQIGEMEGGASERATGIARAFSEHGLETTASADIRHDIWKKLMVNVGVSAMSGITGLTIGEAVAIPELRRMCYGAVAEAVPVAQADGVELTHEESREVLDMVIGPGGTGGNKSSLCVDLLKSPPDRDRRHQRRRGRPRRALRDRDPDQRHASGAGEGTGVALPGALTATHECAPGASRHHERATGASAAGRGTRRPRHRPSGQLPRRSRGGEAVPRLARRRLRLARPGRRTLHRRRGRRAVRPQPGYRDVHFAVTELQHRIGREGGRVLGAGMACPAAIAGHCGEVIANLDPRGPDASRVARVAPDGSCVVEPYRAALFAGLANLYVTDGAPGPVLEIEVSHRTGAEGSLPQAVRAALAPLEAAGAGPIALGGVFQLLAGQVRCHVMPDYDCIDHAYYDVEREQVVSDFLRFYEPVGPGLLCFAVLWTGDPTGGALDLRPSGEHTHCYHPTEPGLGGHYHFDVTPEAVHCRGWFAPAEAVYRVGNIYSRLRSASGA